MKAKKITKRLRKLSAEFHALALTYDGETGDGECARLFTISDVCQLLADEVFSGSVKTHKKTTQNMAARTPLKRKERAIPDWTKYKGKNFSPDKAAD